MSAISPGTAAKACAAPGGYDDEVAALGGHDLVRSCAAPSRM
jgi:hypothetical protein